MITLKIKPWAPSALSSLLHSFVGICSGLLAYFLNYPLVTDADCFKPKDRSRTGGAEHMPRKLREEDGKLGAGVGYEAADSTPPA